MFAEHGFQAQFEHSEKALAEDASAHFAGAELAIDEYDRYLHHFKLAFEGLKLHFNLESISFEFNLVKGDSLQYSATIAYEAGCRVA